MVLLPCMLGDKLKSVTKPRALKTKKDGNQKVMVLNFSKLLKLQFINILQFF